MGSWLAWPCQECSLARSLTISFARGPASSSAFLGLIPMAAWTTTLRILHLTIRKSMSVWQQQRSFVLHLVKAWWLRNALAEDLKPLDWFKHHEDWNMGTEGARTEHTSGTKICLKQLAFWDGTAALWMPRDRASCSGRILIRPGTPLSSSKPAAAQLQLESAGLHEHQHQDQYLG